ncbi:MAG: AAA family ATPase [Gammaproteobacteria bacterium]
MNEPGETAELSPSDLNSLGLLMDPFSDEVGADDFFSESQRTQRLNLLLHLAPYGEVLLVTGPAGSGKTSLLKQFLARSNQAWRITELNASESVSSRQLYSLLGGERFKDQLFGDIDDALIDDLREHFRMLRQGAQIPVLVIDDAHLLSEEILLLLAKLSERDVADEKLLGIIMFCAPDIEEVLSREPLQAFKSKISHTFEVTPFSEDDTEAYVRHRLAKAGMVDEGPFTQAVLRVLYNSSQGLPGKINELAKVILRNSVMDVDEARLSLSSNPGRGRLKRYLPLSVVMVIAIVTLTLQGPINNLFEQGTQQSETGKTVDESAPEKFAIQRIERKPKDEQSVTKEKPIKKREASIEHTSRIVKQSAADQVSVDSLPEQKVVTASSSMQKADEVVEVIPMQDEFVENKVTFSENVSRKQKIQPLASLAKNENPAPVEKEKPTPADAKKPTQLEKHLEWIQKQDGKSFTLQLLGLGNEQKIRNFIQQHKLAHSSAYYRIEKKGKPLFILIYGVYSSRAAATKASKELSRSLARINPWIRPFSDIQAAI